jgi:hypothetical protein
MKKNVASQSIGAQMITAADGTEFTGSVTVTITGDNGTQTTGSVGSGACAHEGHGYHSYAPAQAETNFDHIAFTFFGTGAITQTVQVFTSFPQTGDNFALIGATGSGLTSLATQASVNTIDGIVDDILVDTAEIGAAGAGLTNINLPNQTMDIVGNITGNLSGSVGTVTGLTASDVGAIKTKTDAMPGSILTTALTESYAADGAAGTLTQILYAIQQMLQEKSVSSTTMTVKKLDGSTTAMTFTLSDATNPTSITRAS